jgi:hypothetical protein
MALFNPDLCSVCRSLFDSQHSILAPHSFPIDHTKATFIASVKDSCRLCNVICRSMFGWIYTQASDRVARDSGTAEIPDNLRLRCSFSVSQINSSEQSALPQGHVAALSEELQKGNAASINQVLNQYGLGLWMNVWNEDRTEDSVSMVVRPVVRTYLEE